MGLSSLLAPGVCLNPQHPEGCGRLPHHPSRCPSPTGVCAEKAKQFGWLLFWGGWGQELQLSKTKLDSPRSCSSGTVRLDKATTHPLTGKPGGPGAASKAAWVWDPRLPGSFTGFGVLTEQQISGGDGSRPFGATLWAPTGPTAGDLPNTTGRAPVGKAMASVGPCTHTGGSQGEVIGHLGEQIF